MIENNLALPAQPGIRAIPFAEQLRLDRIQDQIHSCENDERKKRLNSIKERRQNKTAEATRRRSTTCSNSSPTPPLDPSNSLPVIAMEDIKRYNNDKKNYYNRSMQRSLIYDIHDTLHFCGTGVINNPDGSPGTSKFICDHGTGSVRHAGVMNCKSPWACPVCAPKVASKRASALAPQIERYVEDSCSVTLSTFTIRHSRKSDLNEMLELQSKAWARLTSGKWFNKLRSIGTVEFVRGYDVTWSPTHGWHPHIHSTVILGLEHDDVEVCEALKARWRKAVESLGGTTSNSAQHFDRADDPAKAARYAVTPSAVYESLALSMKRARGKASGMTPFEILELAVADKVAKKQNSQWIALWREYVKCTKGKRQVVTSSGLTLKMMDEDIVDELSEEDIPLTVSGESLKEMDGLNLVPEVLAVMRENIGEPQTMREKLRPIMAMLVTRDWRIHGWDVGETKKRFRTVPDEIDREAFPDDPYLKISMEMTRYMLS